MKNIELLAGRILLAHIFILAGLNKLGAGYASTQAYMEAMGVPGALLPAVIVLQIGAGIALAVGLFTRPASWALAGFSIVAAAIFHSNFADQMQVILFMKNIALAGGLVVLAAAGSGRLALDQRQPQPAGDRHGNPQSAAS